MAKQGKTTGNLKMRTGPGMQFDPPIAFLVPDTALEILGEEGDWWKVRAAGKEGYVGKKYVAVTETAELDKTPPAAKEGDKTLPGVDKSPKPSPITRPAVKVAPPKAIAAKADDIDRSQAPKPAASKPATPRTSTTVSSRPMPGRPKPKGPPSGVQKK